MIHAVALGLSQMANASYAHRYVASKPAAIHLERNWLGQRKRGVTNFRARSRGSVNGHAMQKRFPAISSAITASPRQYVHGSTPARFIGATWGPKNPSNATTAANSNIATWTPRRKWRCR